ncbi:MAG: hypothetical protein OXC07_13005, partial [Kistimonas sp.]|nr:hypothetical protein [Kistimonas sp.]
TSPLARRKRTVPPSFRFFQVVKHDRAEVRTLADTDSYFTKYATPSDARHHPESTASASKHHFCVRLHPMQKLRLEKNGSESENTTGVTN